MKKPIVYIISGIFSLLMLSCAERAHDAKERELEIKEKELELKEKELEIQLKEKQLTSVTPAPDKKSDNSTSKQLRFLFVGNGGLVGYYSDGSIIGCPKCEYVKSNLDQMYNAEPMGTYTMKDDDEIFVDGKYVEKPDYDDGWVLIDYKWREPVPRD